MEGKFNPEEALPGFFADLQALYDSKYVKRPIVLIPECTNTNGKGVLQIPPSVMNDLISPALLKQDFSVHTLRIDHNFSYSNLYNTTDESGLWTAALTLT